MALSPAKVPVLPRGQPKISRTGYGNPDPSFHTRTGVCVCVCGEGDTWQANHTLCAVENSLESIATHKSSSSQNWMQNRDSGGY